METVYVSHSTEETCFVNLLVALLEHHGLTTGSSSAQRGGEKSANEENVSLEDVDILIAVMPEDVSVSELQAKEIAEYQTSKPDAPVISLLLPSTNRNSLPAELGESQVIDFSRCMLTGFERLFALLNRPFLPRSVICENSVRKAPRRVIDDRRSQDLMKRMRVGFWLSYSRATGKGKFDDIDLGVYDQFKIIEALMVDAVNYDYFDDAGNRLEVKDVLEERVHNTCERMKNWGDYIKSIYVIEGIAEDLFETHNVNVVDRRNNGERRNGNNNGNG